MDLGRLHRPSNGDGHSRYSLRDQVVKAAHDLGRSFARYSARRWERSCWRSRAVSFIRRLHHQSASRRRHRRESVDRLQLRRSTTRSRARWTRPPAGSPSLLLEERQVGGPGDAFRFRPSRLLGVVRISQLWGPMAGAALPGRLNWLIARATEIIEETQRVRSIVLDCPGWPGHLPGHHIDIRLTAEDGYQAQRSYSIAAPADGERVVITVELVDEGEVSRCL